MAARRQAAKPHVLLKSGEPLEGVGRTLLTVSRRVAASRRAAMPLVLSESGGPLDGVTGSRGVPELLAAEPPNACVRGTIVIALTFARCA